MPLFYLVYESLATQAFTEADLQDLLLHARNYNTKQDVTGLLLYVPSGKFIQVLEGERSQVMGLYQHIARDPRHQNCTILASGPLAVRRFGEWRMGFHAAAPDTSLASLLGFVDTSSASFLLPLIPALSSTLLNRLLDYVRRTPPQAYTNQLA
ncbi:BLUF domain-containing protein [Hymenobacter baengnokdamensis]|uniref:BLUF domain-containing protein n=1 Tax=Hymenobacter baengnokdamensis TaxID=2615203 RepID=UPI0012448B93|nr:BLUF domain-containing protein [Hymenobacter baengnokdamensis]